MRLFRGSLRSRIIWSTTLISASAMAAMIGTVILVLSALSGDRVDTALSDRFDAVSATLVTDKSGVLTELKTPDDTIDDSSWVFDTNGQQIAGPTAGRHVQATVNSLSRVTARKSFERRDRAFLAAPVPDEKTGKTLAVVVVAESLKPYESTRSAVLVGLIALGVLVTAGTGALAAWTVGRTLDPVNSMASRAEEWSEHDLESRFEPGPADDEIAHLGNTLNLLLDRVATTIRSEQRLTSELAHELRTPLTAIRGEAELALMASNDPRTRERLDRVVASVDRLSAIITTLVGIARGQGSSGARANIAAVVDAIVGDRGVAGIATVDTTGVDDALDVAAPAALLERALAPLVDNALEHAGAKVSLTTAVHDRTVRITVSDDGPGVALDALDDVFLAGVRSGSSTGAGLGLALSRRVARTLGGDIHLVSPAGPTTFALDLPAR